MLQLESLWLLNKKIMIGEKTISMLNFTLHKVEGSKDQENVNGWKTNIKRIMDDISCSNELIIKPIYFLARPNNKSISKNHDWSNFDGPNSNVFGNIFYRWIGLN